MKYKKFFFSFLGAIFVFLLWSFVSNVLSEEIMPSPLNVFKRVLFFIYDINFIRELFITIVRSIIAFILSLFIGSIIGIFSGVKEEINYFFTVPVIILQGMPPILWVIPVIVIFGVNSFSVVLVTFFIVLPIIIINVQEGVKAIDKNYFKIFKVFNYNFWGVITKLIIPKISSVYKSLFVICVVLALKSSIVSEWFGAKNGAGKLINSYFYSYNMRSFYGVSLIFVTIVFLAGIFSNFVANYIFSRKRTKHTKLEFLNFSDNEKITFSTGNGIGKIVEKYVKKYVNSKIYSAGEREEKNIAGKDADLKIYSAGEREEKNIAGKDADLKIYSIDESKTKSIVEIRDLNFSFGEKQIIKDLNLKINYGELVVIVGQSGVGKTTLANILIGLYKNYKGEIVVPQKKGILFQDDLLLENFDLIQNVLIAVDRSYKENIRYSIAYDSLKKVGLETHYNYFIDEISGGMKKRCSFARLLSYNPEFVILDEPFNNIDKKGRIELYELFYRLFPARGIPSVVITHYPEDIKFTNSIFYEMKDKKLIRI